MVLLRVRRMRELGLPLDRIAGLVTGPAADLRAELDALDAELAAQADRIAAQRARLAALRADAGDPDLPPPLDALFARAAAAGDPPRALQQEEELLLDLALHPERGGWSASCTSRSSSGRDGWSPRPSSGCSWTGAPSCPRSSAGSWSACRSCCRTGRLPDQGSRRVVRTVPS